MCWFQFSVTSVGIGDGGNGTRTAQNNQKKKIIVLWTHDEKIRRLSGERNHARHYTRGKKRRETKDVVDGQHEIMDWNVI